MISRLKWNETWPGLGQPPAQDDDAIVREYARLVSEIDGVKGVWAQFEGRELAILTLIVDDRGVMRLVHGAESKIYDSWPDALINFRVYRFEDSLIERVQGRQPILTEA